MVGAIKLLDWADCRLSGFRLDWAKAGSSDV
jgi:hypothetical protein